MATPPISRSVAAKPHNVKRCSLAAEVQDPGNPCQLRGTNAHEVAFMEARVQIFGNCGRHCHLEPHLTLPCSYTRCASGTISEKVRCTPCVWCNGGWRKHDS